jgi:pimeloyl-ACP methyl ester carboxylesterase
MRLKLVGKYFRWTATRLALIYALVVSVLYVEQARCIYQPSITSPARWAAEARQTRLQVLPGSNALVIEPAYVGSATKTAILFHGNTGDAWMRLSRAGAFTHRGYRLILAEYPGYGPNSGALSQKSLVDAALKLTDQVTRRWPGQLTLVGESLGTGVVAQIAAARPAMVEKLVLLTPFRSLTETAARKMWFVPVSWLLKSPFNSSAALQHYRGRSAVLVAGHDELVGPAAGLALHAQLAGQGDSTLVVLPTAGHNTWQFAVTAQQWDQLLR